MAVLQFQLDFSRHFGTNKDFIAMFGGSARFFLDYLGFLMDSCCCCWLLLTVSASVFFQDPSGLRNI